MTAAQASSSLLTLACITLILPAACEYRCGSRSETSKAYLEFVDRPENEKRTPCTPKDEMGSASAHRIDHASASEDLPSAAKIIAMLSDEGAPDPPDASLGGLLILSRGTSIILLLTYVGYLIFQLKTHSSLFEADTADGEEEEVPDMDPISSGIWLCIITVITAFAADVLVGSIDETAQQYHIPKRFIGLILLPLVGNAAEHVTSVWMACKGKASLPSILRLDSELIFQDGNYDRRQVFYPLFASGCKLTVVVAVGSSIQIAAGMIPLLVIIAWPLQKNLTLFFVSCSRGCAILTC
jgi:Ca2+:H+ antiporter